MHLRKTDAAEQQWMQWAQWAEAMARTSPQVPPGLTLLIEGSGSVSPVSAPHWQHGRQTLRPWVDRGVERPTGRGPMPGRGLVLRGLLSLLKNDSDIVGLAPRCPINQLLMTPDKSFHLFLEAMSLSRLHLLEGGDGGGGPQDPIVTSTRNSPVLANFLSFLFSQYPYDSGVFFFFTIRTWELSYMSRNGALKMICVPFHLPLWEVIIFNLWLPSSHLSPTVPPIPFPFRWRQSWARVTRSKPPGWSSGITVAETVLLRG